MDNKSKIAGLPPLDELLKRVNVGDSDKARYAALAKRFEDMENATTSRGDSFARSIEIQEIQSKATKKSFDALERSFKEYEASSQEREKKYEEQSAQMRETVARMNDAIAQMKDIGKSGKPAQQILLSALAEQLNATPVPGCSSELLPSLSKCSVSIERVYNYLTKMGVYVATTAGRARFIADVNHDKSDKEMTGYANKTYAALSHQWKQFFIADLYKDLRPRAAFEEALVVGGLVSLVLSACCVIGSWCMSEPSKSRVRGERVTYEQEMKDYDSWKRGLAYAIITAGIAGVGGLVGCGYLASNKNVDLKSAYFDSFLKDAAKQKS